MGHALGQGSWSVAAGTIGRAATGAIAAEVRSAGTAAAGEAAITPGGVATLLSAESAAGSLRVSGRWRYRAAEARHGACELSVEGGPRAARARIHASGGPSGPSGTIGRLELECRLGARGLGPITIRAGRSRTDGFSTASGATVRTERYAVLDASIARSAGRGLSLLATRRERETAEGIRLGSSLGGRVDLTLRRRGRLEVFVEAARADQGGGAAWGSGLFAGGSTALRSRTRGNGCITIVRPRKPEISRACDNRPVSCRAAKVVSLSKGDEICLALTKRDLPRASCKIRCLLCRPRTGCAKQEKQQGKSEAPDRHGIKKGVYHRQTPPKAPFHPPLKDELDRVIHIARPALRNHRVAS